MAKRHSIFGEEEETELGPAEQEPTETAEVEEKPDGTVEVRAEEEDSEPGQTREDKKRARSNNAWARMKEEKAAAEERARQVELELERVRTAQAVAQQFQQQPQQNQGKSPLDQALEQLDKEQEAIAQRYDYLNGRGELNEQSIRELRQLAANVQNKRTMVIVQADRQQSAGQQQQQAQQAILQARYGDLMQNQQAWAYANGQWMSRVAQGEQDSWQLRDSIASEARQRFRIGGAPPPPDEQTRQRFSGMRGGGGGGSGGGQTYTLTKGEKQMARAAYRGLPEEQAYAKFAKDIKAPLEKERNQMRG